MQQGHYNKQFTDQFRGEHFTYPCFAEEQYQNMRFRQFAGRENEMEIIGNVLVEKISDAANIKALRLQLEKKNIPDAFRLSCLVRGVYDAFYSYVQDEPHNERYFHKLLTSLEQFFFLIDSYQKNMEHLLMQLDIYVRCALDNDESEIFHQHMEDILAETDLYKKDISSYYNFFYARLDQESDHGQGVSLTSRVELYLLQLISFIETLIISLEELQLGCGKWHFRLLDIETQEMYN